MTNDFDTLTPEDQELITRIKWKVDSQSVASALEKNPCQPYVYPPASVEEIRWAEAGIGAKLPSLIRELFL